MRFYVTQSFRSYLPNGRAIVGNAGEKISKATYDKLSARLQSLCIPARNAPRNGDFSSAECDFLVSNHVAGMNHNEIIPLFYENFPNHKVNGGVECQLRIIAGQDNTLEDQGLNNPGRILLHSMMRIAPWRFV